MKPQKENRLRPKPKREKPSNKKESEVDRGGETQERHVGAHPYVSVPSALSPPHSRRRFTLHVHALSHSVYIYIFIYSGALGYARANKHTVAKK